VFFEDGQPVTIDEAFARMQFAGLPDYTLPAAAAAPEPDAADVAPN